MTEPAGTVTSLLLGWRRGEDGALGRLMPIVYRELRRIAEAHLHRERGDHTLEPAALVHEAYLRLVEPPRVDWTGRAHFFALASRVMRQVLVDHARRRRAGKRAAPATGLRDDLADPAALQADELLALDDALRGLAALDERQAQIVVLRYFGGLEVAETAAVLGVSPATVKRDWTSARAWLHRRLGRGAAPR